MLLYVAGKYRDTTPELVNQNIELARKVSVELWKMGHVVICPHANTSGFEADTALSVEAILDGDLRIVERCDGIVVLPNWTDSEGAKLEKSHADLLGIPAWFYPDVPAIHVTEKRCPVQSRAFVQLVMQAYRLHLRKNSDYSPNNVLGPGFLGVVTRLWDKVSRIMELSGFRFRVTEPGEFVGPKDAANEPLDDSLIDAANYSIIGLLLRRGQWGC